MKEKSLLPILLLLIITVVSLSSCKKEKKLHFNNQIEITLGVFPTKNLEKISIAQIKTMVEKSNIPEDIKRTISEEILKDNLLKVEIKGPEEIEFPNVSYVKTFGFGFDDEKAVECASAGSLILLSYTSDTENILQKNLALMWITYLLAKKFDGFIYDLNSKELFTTDYYDQINLKNNFKDLRIHILVQKYAYTPGSYRIVSLGMNRFGIPDFEIRDFKTTASIALERLVYGICRKFLELRINNKNLTKFPKEISLSVGEIYKATGEENKIEGKQKEEIVKASFKPGSYENGDSQKNIVRIYPPKGMDMDKWCEDVSGKVAGFIIKRKYDVNREILKKIYEEAQKNLPQFKELFKNRGKKDSFFAKISIKCSNIEEFIWLKITGEKDGKYLGLAQGDAAGCPNVTAGTPFYFSDKDIKDWIVILENGKIFGDFGKKIK